jgi:predicted dienelactone hydrolase
MKNKISTLILIIGLLALPFSTVWSQNQIGHTTITFNDPDRTGGFGSGGGAGRQIQTEVYYPADVAGTDVAVANGEFPVIVFGHGFVMVWEAYENIWEELVPQGYIMAFPRTEGGFTPSHEDFGKDLSLVLDDMLAFNQDNTSLFYERLNNRSAIMGHSMGGGSSMLAAAQNTNANTVIGLAPAETNPSAITAAGNITIPALVLSGENDGVTPDDEHHIPIYDELASECKYFVSILGGAHCYFANSNFNCDFGEGTASSGISVSRAEQQQTSYDAYTPWLDYYLKEDATALQTFEGYVDNDTRVNVTFDCTSTANIQEENNFNLDLNIFPNPTSDVLTISSINIINEKGSITDQLGRKILEFNFNNGHAELNLSDLPQGIYFVEIQQDGIKLNKKFIKR